MQVLFFTSLFCLFGGFFTVCLKVKGRKVESEQQKWHSAERQSYLRAAGIFFLHSLSPFGAVLLLRLSPFLLVVFQNLTYFFFLSGIFIRGSHLIIPKYLLIDKREKRISYCFILY